MFSGRRTRTNKVPYPTGDGTLLLDGSILKTVQRRASSRSFTQKEPSVMQRQGVEFIGPTLHPMRKWVVGFALLGLCAILLLLGTIHGFPAWLQWIGWALIALYVLGGSTNLLVRSLREQDVQCRRRIYAGQIAFLPRSWQRWILDEPDLAGRSIPNTSTQNDLE